MVADFSLWLVAGAVFEFGFWSLRGWWHNSQHIVRGHGNPIASWYNIEPILIWFNLGLQLLGTIPKDDRFDKPRGLTNCYIYCTDTRLQSFKLTKKWPLWPIPELRVRVTTGPRAAQNFRKSFDFHGGNVGQLDIQNRWTMIEGSRNTPPMNLSSHTTTTLPETKSLPWKIDGWKINVLLGWPIFRECIYKYLL